MYGKGDGCRLFHYGHLTGGGGSGCREVKTIDAATICSVYISTYSSILKPPLPYCTTGTRLIFSREGLVEPLSEALFSDSELQSELHTIAQQLLVSATAVPDGVAFLQASLGYQVM